GRTPSDLPLVKLSQAEIERLELCYPQIEDILPLSPLQEGRLFHALYDSHGPDVYMVQLVLGLDGPLEGEALQDAANVLLQRHASLRAPFEPETLPQPVQIIVPLRALPWRFVDLCSLDEAAQEDRLTQILAED